MGFYSRRHFARVSPKADTPEEIRERIAHRLACEEGVKDREARFPNLTAENLAEAIRYQEQRIDFHRSHPEEAS